MDRSYFATVAKGLEEVAAKELETLGAREVRTTVTGVHFQGDQALLYKVNLWSRLIFKVLMPIFQVECATAEQLYSQVKKLDWSEYLTVEQSFAVQCTGSNYQLNHTHFTALGIKNAIVDQQKDRFGKRSNIDLKFPDLLINAHIDQNVCTISLDSSRESLHRRGYHLAMGLAPLKETLAAGIIQISGYNGKVAFYDPFCGSGTLPIEAALLALNIAPGLSRESFGFESWLDFKSELWEKIKKEALESRLKTLQAPIIGSDLELSVLRQARSNAHLCKLEGQIEFQRKALADVEPKANEGILICNPPYGKRIGDTEDLRDLYRQLGDVLKQRFKGWSAYVLTGNRELAKVIGLRSSSRYTLYNGSIACVLLKYDLY
jgi:putative N6-adenine-specific DNA methylase